MKRAIFLAMFPISSVLFGQNIGIGTSNPTQKLTIQTPAGGNRWGLFHTDGTIGLGSYVGVYQGISYGFFGTSSLHSLSFFTNNNTTLPAMTLHTGGLGIGTTEPLTTLHVANTSVFEPTTVVIGRNYTAGGYTAMYMGNSANQNGYNYIQSVSSSGSGFGLLVLNPYGGGPVQSGAANAVFSHQVTGNLQAQQDINLAGGTIKSANTGSAGLVPITMGVISSQGVKLSGMANLSCTRTGNGHYSISIAGEIFTNTNDQNYMVLISCKEPKFAAGYLIFPSTNTIEVDTMNNYLEYTNTVCNANSCPVESSFIEFQPGRFADTEFSIVVYKM